MDPLITAGLISGGSSLLGGLFGGSSAKKAAKAQMAFQERMDNTKYQRSRADLEAAGYNPMMAVTNGVSGAPSGAMDVSGQIMSQAVSNAGTSAVSAARTASEIKQMDLQNQKIIADTSASNTASDLNRSLAAQAVANTLNTSLKSEGERNRNKVQQIKGRAIDAGTSLLDDILDGISGNSAKSIKKPPKLPPFKLRSDSERLAPYMKH